MYSLGVDEDVGDEERHTAAKADEQHGVHARQQQLAQAWDERTQSAAQHKNIFKIKNSNKNNNNNNNKN
jgi:hypothetical protein